MRVLHTSDWHLGKRIADYDRTATFKKFLDWLYEAINENKVDVLVVAGDIFDTNMPPHSAQNLYYSFLNKMRDSSCKDIVIVAGNHDSSSFIDAPKALLEHMKVHVVGAADSCLENELKPIYKNNELQAVICAVPFLKEKDLYQVSADYAEANSRDEILIEATKEHYEKIVDKAVRLRGEKDIPIIATGHLTTAGITLSGEERDLYIGSLGCIPAELFPKEIDYLALGHIHEAKSIAQDPSRNYSGSPLLLDFSSTEKHKIVRLVDFEGKQASVKNIEVPLFDRLRHIKGNQQELIELASELAEQSKADGLKTYVFAEHTGNVLTVNLSAELSEIFSNTPVELIRLRDSYKAQQYLNSLEEGTGNLEDLTPELVFQKRLVLEQDENEIDPERIKKLSELYRSVCQELRSEIDAVNQNKSNEE